MMMEAIEFIHSAYADEYYFHGEPDQITNEEAAFTINEWKTEGFEVPDMVTPELFSAVWNLYCKM